MPSYKVTFTVYESNIQTVRKKCAEMFGETTAAHIDKINRKQSRADRLAEAEGTCLDAKSEVESLKDELQDWKDGMPENLQSGSKADEIDEAINGLEEIIDALDNIDFSRVSFPGMY
jgi:hypothetical protein